MIPSVFLLVPPLLLVGPASAAPRLLVPGNKLDTQCVAATEIVTSTVYQDDFLVLPQTLVPASPSSGASTPAVVSPVPSSAIDSGLSTTAYGDALPASSIPASAPSQIPATGTAAQSLGPAPSIVSSSPTAPDVVSHDPQPLGNLSEPVSRPGSFRNALYFTNW